MQAGFEAINDKYILYNMPITKNGKESSVSYIMDRNGKNAREINGERIFAPVLYKNYIYYLTEDRYLHRMGIDGKDDKMLTDVKIYNLNVSDNGIYYFEEILSAETGQVESLSVRKMDLDGNNNKKIYTLEETSNSLCLLKDWVFFLDSNEEAGKMDIISLDGKQKIDLFTFYFSDYFMKEESEEIEESEDASSEVDESGS